MASLSTSGRPLTVVAKVVVVVVVLSACLFVCSEAAAKGKEVLSGGKRRWNDTVLFNQTTKDSASIFSKAKKEVCYPKVRNLPRVNITAYSVWDLGKGGSVNITSGGVNSTQICFRYTAKNIMSGFEFLTTIWGYYR